MAHLITHHGCCVIAAALQRLSAYCGPVGASQGLDSEDPEGGTSSRSLEPDSDSGSSAQQGVPPFAGSISYGPGTDLCITEPEALEEVFNDALS